MLPRYELIRKITVHKAMLPRYEQIRKAMVHETMLPRYEQIRKTTVQETMLPRYELIKKTTDNEIIAISHSFPTNNISTRLNPMQNLISDQFLFLSQPPISKY